MRLNFTKMQGLGNDFIVIDNLDNSFNEKLINISQLSNRHIGIGFDQLLIVELSNKSNMDFKYRIFNADGHEVQQCGNGARCFALYVFEKKLTNKRKLNVETINGDIELNIIDASSVTVNMGEPEFTLSKIPANFDSQDRKYIVNGVEVGVLSMGNPHAVIISNDIANLQIDEVAQNIQNSGYFPESVNVGFMQINSSSNISLRVYSPSAEVVGHGPGQETLQVGKEGVTISNIQPTGNYAVVLFFSDGHDTGIYSWSHLKKLALNKDALWKEYLQKLKDSGYDRCIQ